MEQINSQPWTNILRSTTEAFSGIAGGCDSVSGGSFDEKTGTSTDFGTSLGRSMLLIAKKECELESVSDPAGGSWFIENLTQQTAREAWRIFQEIEKNGGMSNALKNGFVHKAIRKNADSVTQAVTKGKRQFIGINAFPDSDHELFIKQMEKKSGSAGGESRPQTVKTVRPAALQVCDLHKDICSGTTAVRIKYFISEAGKGATADTIKAALSSRKKKPEEIEKIGTISCIAEYEKLVAASLSYAQKHGSLPLIFIAIIGDPEALKARRAFIAEFLEPVGFHIAANEKTFTQNGAAEEFNASGAHAVVLCAPNEMYREITPGFVQKIRENGIEPVVYIAGYPENDIEMLCSAGAEGFIHLKSDRVEIFRSLQKKTGVCA